MSSTRKSWEPARTPHFFPALTGGQAVFEGQHIVHAIVMTNSSSSTSATMAVLQDGVQIGSVSAPPNETAELPVPASGLLLTGLSVSTDAAVDVTVLTA